MVVLPRAMRFGGAQWVHVAATCHSAAAALLGCSTTAPATALLPGLQRLRALLGTEVLIRGVALLPAHGAMDADSADSLPDELPISDGEGCEAAGGGASGLKLFRIRH